MNSTLVFSFRPSTLSTVAFLDETNSWLALLGRAHPDFSEWWIPPQGPGGDFVSFRNRNNIIERMGSDAKRLDAEYGVGAGGGRTSVASMVLTNAGCEKDWHRKGRVALYVNLGMGQLRLAISVIDGAYRDPGALLWSLLSCTAEDSRVQFAQTNVRQKVGSELVLYSRDRAPFPHRDYLGWMGYVNVALTQDQLPEAARLERRGQGTLILSTEVLDLSDPHAVMQANQVEMRLVDLELLPVIDPALK
ncbi:immunity 52 family protein [Stenotrophomonas sp. SI-NJAU-1]|uniref:Imm52 family immunity protein n=1 Tax=Stenotrophomonas sp. SI-NJAU-1 TaxID=2886359 RepID=UPI001E2F2E7A|nr:Imm52 family immunity protein [Stenotrophomonas sp. SI-NJAU-1]UEX19871.1 immunity 52 family protein [Stenotrophomonas sp. SI-NJAU-1]